MKRKKVKVIKRGSFKVLKPARERMWNLHSVLAEVQLLLYQNVSIAFIIYSR